MKNATWYRSRPQPRPHCVRWGPSSSSRKGHSSPPRLFGLCLLCPRSPISATAELLFWFCHYFWTTIAGLPLVFKFLKKILLSLKVLKNQNLSWNSLKKGLPENARRHRPPQNACSYKTPMCYCMFHTSMYELKPMNERKMQRKYTIETAKMHQYSAARRHRMQDVAELLFWFCHYFWTTVLCSSPYHMHFTCEIYKSADIDNGSLQDNWLLYKCRCTVILAVSEFWSFASCCCCSSLQLINYSGFGGQQ